MNHFTMFATLGLVLVVAPRIGVANPLQDKVKAQAQAKAQEKAQAKAQEKVQAKAQGGAQGKIQGNPNAPAQEPMQHEGNPQ